MSPAVIAAVVCGALLVLIALHIFLIAPRRCDRVKFKLFLGRVYAHRGMFDNVRVPENSLPAFRAAVKKGHGIELDIHLTADGEVVVVHDDDLTRLCGVAVKVEDRTLAELRALPLLGTMETIPTLHEVLEVVGDKVPLIVELKGESTDTRLVPAAFPILENSGCRYCVESFNPFLVAAYGRAVPHVMRGILVSKFSRDGTRRDFIAFLLQRLLFNCVCRPDFIAARWPYGGYYPIMLCRLFGAATFAWTIREKKEYYACKERFDAFICEDLDELLKK